MVTSAVVACGVVARAASPGAAASRWSSHSIAFVDAERILPAQRVVVVEPLTEPELVAKVDLVDDARREVAAVVKRFGHREQAGVENLRHLLRTLLGSE